MGTAGGVSLGGPDGSGGQIGETATLTQSGNSVIVTREDGTTKIWHYTGTSYAPVESSSVEGTLTPTCGWDHLLRRESTRLHPLDILR